MVEMVFLLLILFGFGFKLFLFFIFIVIDEFMCLGWLGELGDVSLGFKLRDLKFLELLDVGGLRDWWVSLVGLVRLIGGLGEGEGEW